MPLGNVTQRAWQLRGAAWERYPKSLATQRCRLGTLPKELGNSEVPLGNVTHRMEAWQLRDAAWERYPRRAWERYPQRAWQLDSSRLGTLPVGSVTREELCISKVAAWERYPNDQVLWLALLVLISVLVLVVLPPPSFATKPRSSLLVPRSLDAHSELHKGKFKHRKF